MNDLSDISVVAEIDLARRKVLVGATALVTTIAPTSNAIAARPNSAGQLAAKNFDSGETRIRMDTIAVKDGTEAAQQTGSEKTAIRPFHVNVPEAELSELRGRINATRWPERETVADQSQGVQLATVQKLARYWATEYDWRKVEARRG